jgi:hypothetical protein
MKYLCLVYLEKNKLHAVPDSECFACGQGLRTSGALVAAEALQPVDTATTVRVRGGKVFVTDGPFAETKEQLAGFYLVDARDLNDASRSRRRFRPRAKAAWRCGRSGSWSRKWMARGGPYGSAIGVILLA